MAPSPQGLGQTLYANRSGSWVRARELADLDRDVWFELDEFELAPASADSMLLRLTGRWGARRECQLKQPEVALDVDGTRHVLDLLTGSEAHPLATADGCPWMAGYSAPTSLLVRPRVRCTLELEGAVFALIPVGIPAEPRSQEGEPSPGGRSPELGAQQVDVPEALAIANQRAAAAEQDACTQLEARAHLERLLGERESELSRLRIQAETATHQRELAISSVARREHDQELRNRRLMQALSVVDVEAARLQTHVMEQERRYATVVGVLERLTTRLEQVEGRTVELDHAIAETERLAAPIEAERARAGELERDLVEERGHRVWLQAERDAERDQLHKQVWSLESELERERSLRELADRELLETRELVELSENEARSLAAGHTEVRRQLGDLVAGTEQRAEALAEHVSALETAMTAVGERSLALQRRTFAESERMSDLCEGAEELRTTFDAQLRRQAELNRELDDAQARAEARATELSVVRGRAEQLESELAEALSARAALDAELAQSEATWREVEAAVAHDRDQLAATERRIQVLGRERDEAVASRQRAETQVQGLRASVAAFNDRLSVFHLRVTNAEARAGALDLRAAEATASIEALEEMTDDLAEQLDARQAELAQARAETEAHERAAEQAAQRVEQLQESLDALTLQQAEQVRQTQARTEELASECKRAAALEAKLDEADGRAHDLEQDIKAAQGRVEVAEHEAQERAREATQAQREAEERERERDAVLAQSAQAAHALAALQERAGEIEGRLAALGGKLVAVDARAGELSGLVGEGDAQLVLQHRELARLEGELAAASQEASLKGEFEQARTEMMGQVEWSHSRGAELERELQQTQRVADVTAAQRDAAVAFLDQARDMIVASQEQVIALDQRLEGVVGQLAEAGERTVAVQALAIEASHQSDRLATDVDALGLQVELGARHAAALEEELAEIAQLKASQSEVTAERDQLERQLRRSEAELLGLGDEAARLRERLDAAEREASADASGKGGGPSQPAGLLYELRLRLANAETIAEAQAEERARLERHLARVELQLEESRALLSAELLRTIPREVARPTLE